MKPLTAFMFPGQGIQKQGMGRELVELFPDARKLFLQADAIAGRSITSTMFNAEESVLSLSINAQPAIFLYQVALAKSQADIEPNIVVGHSFGEYAALVIAECMSFEDAFRLVLLRAELAKESIGHGQKMAMAAIVGIETSVVEECLKDVADDNSNCVYVANYNGPGQTVISGHRTAVKRACERMRSNGAKRTVMLPIEGAFHTPLVSDLTTALSEAINNIIFSEPKYPICQCSSASITADPVIIKENLKRHATSPVDWTRMTETLANYGVQTFVEIGTDNTLQKIVRRMMPHLTITSILECRTFRGLLPDYSVT